jgi:hypothetical protein
MKQDVDFWKGGLDLDTEEGADECNRRARRCEELKAYLDWLNRERKRVKAELKKESGFFGYSNRG